MYKDKCSIFNLFGMLVVESVGSIFILIYIIKLIKIVENKF